MSIADKITRLQTAKSNIATAITNKGGTVASGDGFEDFATDIGTIPSGITPSGTKSITANGTYDVTNHASANVNVQPTNFKQWTYTPSTATGVIKLVNADSWLQSHRTDANLTIFMIANGTISQPSSGGRITSTISTNRMVSNSLNASGIAFRMTASGTAGQNYFGKDLVYAKGNFGGQLTIESDGSLYITATASYALEPIEYAIVAVLT